MTRGEIFDDIYRTNFWGGSGGGSREEVAWPFAAYASLLIKRHGIQKIVDIGCGDGVVGRMIDIRGGTLFSCDVSRVAADLADGYVYDCTEVVPRGDFALVKEVTQHLCNSDVRELAASLSYYPLVLHCTSLEPGTQGPDGDIETGKGFRPVRLADFGCRNVTPILEWTAGGGSYHMEIWRPQA